MNTRYSQRFNDKIYSFRIFYVFFGVVLHCLDSIGAQSCGNTQFRSFDGSCNNAENSQWGQTNTQHLRFLPANYADGISALRTSKVDGEPLPNVREISSAIMGNGEDREDDNRNILCMLWGQFIDHDMTKTPISIKSNGDILDCCDSDASDPFCTSIDTTNDAFFSNHSVNCLGFARSEPIDKSLGSTFEQINQISSFIDGSMIYGVNNDQARALRSFKKGKLKVNQPNKKTGIRKAVLPLGTGSICEGQPQNTNEQCVLAGDDRFAEQIGLTLLHTIFLREHNKICDKLSAINSGWNDERIYQEARKIVIAQIQLITYGEYLPVILGASTMRKNGLNLQENGLHAKNYNPNIEPTTRNEFVTAAYRFGHSMIPVAYACLDNFFESISTIPPIPLHKVFLSNFFYYTPPSSLIPSSNTVNIMDCFLRGILGLSAKRVDQILTVEVRDHLFQATSDSFGVDLGAINILRGRDHGLPTYVEVRKFCGLSVPKDFSDLSGIIPSDTISALEGLYKSVEDMDLFPLGIAEIPKQKDAALGPTFSCIISRQFRALKLGDSFWFENKAPRQIFSTDQLAEIRKITLSKIICSNMDDMPSIQTKAFMLSNDVWNPITDCSVLPYIDFEAWTEG